MKISAIGKIVISIVFSIAVFVNASQEKVETNTMNFGMQAVFTANEGKGLELAEILLEASKIVTDLEGSIIYIVQIAAIDTDKVLITEVWESEAAHKASLKNENVRSLIATAKPLIADMEHILAKPLGGKGL